MYLHLGQDTVILQSSILGIFDLENSTVSKTTRAYLSKAEKAGRVVNVSAELPKSFVVCSRGCGTVVYLCQLSPSTLLKRTKLGAAFPVKEAPL